MQPYSKSDAYVLEDDHFIAVLKQLYYLWRSLIQLSKTFVMCCVLVKMLFCARNAPWLIVYHSAITPKEVLKFFSYFECPGWIRGVLKYYLAKIAPQNIKKKK